SARQGAARMRQPRQTSPGQQPTGVVRERDEPMSHHHDRTSPQLGVQPPRPDGLPKPRRRYQFAAGWGESTPDKTALVTPDRLAFAFYAVAVAAAITGQVWVGLKHVPWPADLHIAAAV